MIYLTNTEVFGIDAAMRGMRNPMNSWANGDTANGEIGPKDMTLARKLAASGPDHGKFMRMITVYVDIRAPMYWWKEFDTYKVGTVANSCSTMHRLTAREFRASDFSTDESTKITELQIAQFCELLNRMRDEYVKTKNKLVWRSMVQLLPMSYMQTRTVMLNYEVLRRIYVSRKNHKLSEWHTFRKWAEQLPYFMEISGLGE